jgi:YbbR domain-containing protein
MTAPLPPGSSTSARWRHMLRGAFLERLGIKALSLLIAILLWLIVKGRQPVQDYVTVRVLPTLDSSLVLLEQPTPLTALVSGRAVDIAKLRADPPAVHRIVDGDVPDTLVFQVAASDVRVAAGLADFVHVLDVQPRSISLRFGNKATRRVPVVNDGRVVMRNGGVPFAADSVQFDPRMVRITGPRRLVRNVKDVRPYSLMIEVNDTLQHLADLDTGGLGVRVLPTQVKVLLRGSASKAKP